MFITVLTRTRH